MPSGIVLNQSDFDNMVGGQLSRQINYLMEQIPRIQAIVTALGSSGLVALPLGTRTTGYTTADANAIINAMNIWYQLYQVYKGTMYVTNGSSPGAGVPTVGNGFNFSASYPSNIWGWGM